MIFTLFSHCKVTPWTVLHHELSPLKSLNPSILVSQEHLILLNLLVQLPTGQSCHQTVHQTVFSMLWGELRVLPYLSSLDTVVPLLQQLDDFSNYSIIVFFFQTYLAKPQYLHFLCL